MTTALQIAEKAIQLADENPDFVYVAPPSDDPFTDCLYVHEGKGSCLFGQAILALGAASPKYLEKNKDSRIKALLWDMSDRGMVEYSDPALLSAMSSAQFMQDEGNTWADSVATLREYVGKVTAA